MVKAKRDRDEKGWKEEGSGGEGDGGRRTRVSRAHLDGLLDKIWEYLDLTRIHTKPKGMNPDYEDPVILSSKKRTVEDFCNQIHKDMSKQFK
ncbi:unnamed protein product [Linum tenue]|uniref:TGS domain-containing protein n=1 Tax=Linum tenue TaxID=586396 RepID=A0AAV0L6W4_9ROSI|nr:unnamed protein product [Linum tenue]